MIVKDKNGKVDLNALMKKLGELNITSLMIEGGSSVNASAISSRIVDKIVVFIAPQIIGGADAVSSIGGKSPARLKTAVKIKNLEIKRVGGAPLLEGYPDF
ncbi:MAG: dihydrofolate reductase family protein [Nitrospirae bacterium]|nr:dihydrofolate reductase family protein [Nitrospirota bacterium]